MGGSVVARDDTQLWRACRCIATEPREAQRCGVSRDVEARATRGLLVDTHSWHVKVVASASRLWLRRALRHYHLAAPEVKVNRLFG